jgi:hypothetical protein
MLICHSQGNIQLGLVPVRNSRLPHRARAGNLTVHQYHLVLGEECGVTSCGGIAASHWNGYDELRIAMFSKGGPANAGGVDTQA